MVEDLRVCISLTALSRYARLLSCMINRGSCVIDRAWWRVSTDAIVWSNLPARPPKTTMASTWEKIMMKQKTHSLRNECYFWFMWCYDWKYRNTFLFLPRYPVKKWSSKERLWKWCYLFFPFSISDSKTQQWAALFPKGACFFITIP